MIKTITKKKLIEITNIVSFENNGDSNEQKYSEIINNNFNNCEKFWKKIIVPQTNRIENSQERNISKRKNISEDLKKVADIHYSIFNHFIFAHNHYAKIIISSFEDFYYHIGTICDLAESLMLHCFFIISDCKNIKIKKIEELSKDDFLNLAGEWYEKNYLKLYDNYFRKGKSIPLNLPSRKNILEEYFFDSKEYVEYLKYARKIREFRNIIAHDQIIGRIKEEGNILAPNLSCIHKYRRWEDVVNVINDQKKIKRDFSEISLHMKNSMDELQNLLNQIWVILIDDFKKLIYEDENPKMLQKYNIQYI